MQETVSIRLEGYRLGRPSYFCPECWDERPEDFADAPGEMLSREEAQGQRCDVCELALFDAEDE